MQDEPIHPDRADHDGYWKEAFDRFLPLLLALLAPDLHRAIDFARGYESVEVELNPDSGGAATTKLFPDRLYRVRLRSGAPAVLFLHFEFQSRSEPEFEQRMYVYHARLFLHLRADVVSLALLADPDPSFRPHRFRWQAFGNTLVFRFRSVKLLDFMGREEEFLASGDPAAILLTIKLLDLRITDEERRLAAKKRVLRTLVRTFREHEITAELTRFLIQGILLQRPARQEFHAEIRRLEKEYSMRFSTIYEDEARAEGKAEGRAEGRAEAQQQSVLRVLRARFGELPLDVVQRVASMRETEPLDAWLERAATAPSLAAFLAEA
jgi:hypothetical protein